MAVTVTPNLTVVSLAETVTGWSGTSGQLDTEVYVQGTTTPASYTYQTGKNTRSSCTFTPATNLDMSGTGNHLYFWMRCDVFPFCEAKTTGTTTASGLTVRLTDGSGNYVEWHVAGSDTWGGEWKCHVVDINHTGAEVYASSGTLDLSDVDVITWYTDNSNSGNIRIIDNTWLDAVRFGTGLTATGTDFDYGDIAADDNLTANKYGVMQEEDGVIFVQGGITIDQEAGSPGGATSFTSSNETLAFRDIPVGTNLYKLDFVGAYTTVNINSLSVLSSGTNDDTRPDFDASGTVGSFTMIGSAINRGGFIDFKAGQSITLSKFNNCEQVDPSTATFNNIQFSNYVGNKAALLWPASTNTHTCSFVDCQNGVEITQTTQQDFVGMNFDDEGSPVGSPARYDVLLNNGGVDITVALDSNSNANSYTNFGSPEGVVTFSSSVTLSFKVIDESGANISGAYASIHDLTGSPEVEIMNTTTNASGVASTNWTGGAVTGSTWRVRKYGYKPYVATVNISTSDIDIPVTLIADPQQT